MLESRSAVYKMLRDTAHKDRQINTFPRPYRSDVTPYKQLDFSRVVREACSSSRPVMSGLKISKAIFLGDVAVGKTCLVNRWRDSTFFKFPLIYKFGIQQAKKDLNVLHLHIIVVLMSKATFTEVENHAVQIAEGMGAEFWAVSSRTGDGVSELFCRMAALAFDSSVCREKELPNNALDVGTNLVTLKQIRTTPVKSNQKCHGGCIS
ncbi:hypothetical protein C0J52_16621 [Blattella germanica]|nr:hypothetical protein C0J52_16621 [Blattella germanica]